MGGHLDGTIWDHLHGVHGRDDRRILLDQTGLPAQRIFQVGVASSLTQPRPITTDRHRPGDDQIDVPQRLGANRLAELRRADEEQL